jgi:hypothetical protein
MKFTRIWLMAALSALYPFVAVAQSPSNTPRSVTGKIVSGSQAMYEDIEIMRRILNQKLVLGPSLMARNSNCTQCHVVSGDYIKNSQGAFVDLTADTSLAHPQEWGAAGSDMNQDGWLNFYASNFHSGDPHRIGAAHATLAGLVYTEGVYLKGQGVVYTLTLPPPSQSLRPWIMKASSKPLTDWERTRQAMRGDSQVPKDPGPAKESQETGVFAALEKTGHLGITEGILKVLAENGHNLSQLAEDEKLTVIVTFRDLHFGAQTSQNQIDPGNPLSAWGAIPEGQMQATWETQVPLRQGGSGSPGAGGVAGTTNAGVGAGPGGAGMGPQSPSSVHDFELLGDRSLKQGKAQEAIKAFQRALNLGPPAKQSAGLYRKIAQADLILEDLAAAKKALDMAADQLKVAAEESPKNTGTAGGSGVTKGPPGPSLPPKLIISAPKKLLDQVASGKISHADFRKQVTIDYFGFSSPVNVEMK